MAKASTKTSRAAASSKAPRAVGRGVGARKAAAGRKPAADRRGAGAKSPPATRRRAAPGDTMRVTKKAGGVPQRSYVRGFEAGKSGRRLASLPTSPTGINTLIRRYGRTLIARSRYLCNNNPYVAQAKEAYVAALVGTGIKPSPLTTNKDIKAEIVKLWRLSTDELDADWRTDFYGLQSIIGAEMFEAGEVFVRIRTRLASDGLQVPMQLQLIPSEMLPFEHNETLPNGNVIQCGIEFNGIGKRVAYWFLRNHPGESDSPLRIVSGGLSDRVRVSADEVMHLFRPMRAGQVRGVPHTSAGIATMAILDLYDDAELERKKTASLFGGVITRSRSDDEVSPFGDPVAQAESGGNEYALEPGAMIELEDGQDIRFSEPADVGATYEPFQYRQLLRGAAGFGVPYADMTGDLRMTSYGSIRAGVVNFRRRIEMQQHHVMVYQFCRVVWTKWFDAAVAAGIFTTFKASEYDADPLAFRDVKWITPKWEWIDPLKDRQAEKLAVDCGFKSRSDVIEAEGYDPEEVDARIKQDQDRAAGYGISFIRLSSTVVVSPDGEKFGNDTSSTAPGAPGESTED
ncbi:phage portal protein [Rhodopseudomonas palustris]